MNSNEEAKAMARSLRDALAGRNVSLPHSACLEIVARQLGFADWNTLCAKLGPDEKPLDRQLSCSFCGKSQKEVRSLIEGGCVRPRRSAAGCTFICDECVTLCAQINVEALQNRQA